MEISQTIQDLLSQPNHAILAVNRPSGAPHLSPVWYLWDGEAFYINTATDRIKYGHIQHNPAISLLVDNAIKGYGYVVVSGLAQIIERDDPAFEPLAKRIVAKYVPPEEAEPFLDSALAPNHVIIRLLPEKVFEA